MPMMLGHIGLGLMILGITVTSSYGITIDDSMSIEQSSSVGDYEFKLTEIGRRNGPNYLAQYASIEISKDGEYIETVYPEKRVYFYKDPDTKKHQPHSELDIYSTMSKDISVTLLSFQFSIFFSISFLVPTKVNSSSNSFGNIFSDSFLLPLK
mgnify:CR=1 FL=1